MSGVQRGNQDIFYEGDEPEAMGQASWHIMVPGVYERTRDVVVQTG